MPRHGRRPQSEALGGLHLEQHSEQPTATQKWGAGWNCPIQWRTRPLQLSRCRPPARQLAWRSRSISTTRCCRSGGLPPWLPFPWPDSPLQEPDLRGQGGRRQGGRRQWCKEQGRHLGRKVGRGCWQGLLHTFTYSQLLSWFLLAREAEIKVKNNTEKAILTKIAKNSC